MPEIVAVGPCFTVYASPLPAEDGREVYVPVDAYLPRHATYVAVRGEAEGKGPKARSEAHALSLVVAHMHEAHPISVSAPVRRFQPAPAVPAVWSEWDVRSWPSELLAGVWKELVDAKGKAAEASRRAFSLIAAL